MKKGAGKKLNKEAITRQPKKFSAAFYNNYDGKITLKYADEVYLKLTCCTAQDIGKEIREIFEDREYRRIKYYFESISLKKKIRPVNRLDMETSGIVIFAKCELC